MLNSRRSRRGVVAAPWVALVCLVVTLAAVLPAKPGERAAPKRLGADHRPFGEYLRYPHGYEEAKPRVDTSNTLASASNSSAAVSIVTIAVKQVGDPVAGARVVLKPLLRVVPPVRRLAFDRRTEGKTDDNGVMIVAVPPGTYQVSVSDGNGGERASTFVAGAKGFQEDLVVNLEPPRRTGVELRGSVGAHKLLVAGPDPALYRTLELVEQMRLPMPMSDRTVLAVDSEGRIVGHGRFTAGSSRFVVNCVKKTLGFTVSPARSLFVESIGGEAEPAFWFPSPQAIASSVPGELVAVGVVESRRVRVKANAKDGAPWPGLDIRCDGYARVLGERVALGIDRVWTDENGEAELEISRGGRVVADGLSLQADTISISTGLVRVVGSRQKTHSWFTEDSRGEFELFVPRVGLLRRPADSLGVFFVPVKVGEPLVLLDWPEKERTSPRRLMYLCVGERMSTWRIGDADLRTGECRVQIEGLSDGEVAVSVARFGVPDRVAERYTSRYEAKGYVTPLRKPGTYILVAKPLYDSVIGVVPFEVSGRAESQLIRISLPDGGARIDEPDGISELWVFAAVGNEWHVMWRSSNCPEVLLLPPARYLLLATAADSVSLIPVDVGDELAFVRCEWEASCEMEFRTAIDETRSARGVDVVVSAPDGRKLVFQSQNDGRAMVVLPRAERYEAWSRHGTHPGPSVRIAATRAQARADLPLTR